MKKRLIAQVELETDEYCQKQADKLGISKSGFVNVVISQYRQQNEMLDQLPGMFEQLKKFEAMGKLKK